MISSGDTAKVTSGDTAITLCAGSQEFSWLSITNTGAVAGQWSIDGTNWAYLPIGSVTLPIRSENLTIRARRFAGGTDLTGLWASAG